MTNNVPNIIAQNGVLEGQVVLVTGAGMGIGAAVAKQMAQAGAIVIVNDYDPAAAIKVVSELENYNLKAIASSGDITDQDTIDEIQKLGVERNGIDVLVNNAGITGEKNINDLNLEIWNRVVDVNLTAPFRLSAALLPQMRKKGRGRIINIASIAGIRVSVLGGAAYTATKSGLIGLTRHLSSELAPDNITVNSILPGVTQTPLVEQATDENTRLSVADSVPLGRMGDPEDIGRLAVYLASDAASFITGVSIPIDGGMTVLPGNYSEYRATRKDETTWPVSV